VSSSKALSTSSLGVGGGRTTSTPFPALTTVSPSVPGRGYTVGILNIVDTPRGSRHYLDVVDELAVAGGVTLDDPDDEVR
jgi:hypothetical protein